MGELAASIIIPLWNGKKYIETCLTAVLEQDYTPLEVIVVDNASEDGSAELVAEKFPGVKLIRLRHNLGFAGGCNAGLRAAQGDILVLLNQDTRVCPGWLQTLSQALQEKTGVAGCKILYPDGKTIQHAGGWIKWPLGIPCHYGYKEQDSGGWDQPKTMEYVTGAAMAFRRQVLEKVGFLDEMFWPGYFEDIDFCFRARNAGYEIRYIPDAVMLHQETTSITDRQQFLRFYHRGRLRFLLKHLSSERFLSEFVPAEEAFLSSAIRGDENKSLRYLYLEAIPIAASVLLSDKAQAAPGAFEKIFVALQKLAYLAWAVDWQLVEEGLTPFPDFVLEAQGERLTLPGSSVPPVASLLVYEPQSQVHILGPLITRFRSWWYRVAARWAIGYLTEQQEVINQRNHHYIRGLERRLMELVEQNTILAKEIAALQVYITRSSNEAGGK